MMRFCYFAILAQALFLSSTNVNAFQYHVQRPLTTAPASIAHRGPSYSSTSQLSMASDNETKKETTWDRITGPKLFKTVTNWNGIHSVPLVPLRILTGMLMIHHGSEGTCFVSIYFGFFSCISCAVLHRRPIVFFATPFEGSKNPTSYNFFLQILVFMEYNATII